MALLQAVILMIYQVQLTALFAYYPEIVSTYICVAKSFLRQPAKKMRCDVCSCYDSVPFDCASRLVFISILIGILPIAYNSRRQEIVG